MVTSKSSIPSPSGRYVATPGVWGCGEGYRVWTATSATSMNGGRAIADVTEKEQAEHLLNMLDAADENEELYERLAEARQTNNRLRLYYSSRRNLIKRLLGLSSAIYPLG